MSSFIGTAGDDNFVGTANYDSFDLTLGGDDTAKGGNSGDNFNLGAALTAGDHLNGGAGYDYIYLNGDYSAGLVLNSGTVTNIEGWNLAAGHSYNFTVTDNTNQSLNGVSINAGGLGATDVLTFNAAAETTNTYFVSPGAADDVVTTGGGYDYFYMQNGGVDTANLGSGNDVFYGYDKVTGADHLDGGDGYDFLYLSGDYSGGLTFQANTIQHIETIGLWSGNSYKLMFDDANVVDGGTLVIDGYGLVASDTLTVNGAAELDGSFAMYGGPGKDDLTGGKGDDQFYGYAGNDKISGGAGDDYISGGVGHDVLSGGAGGDIFYFGEGDSQLANPDRIQDLNDSADVVDISGIDADTTAAYDQQFHIVSSFTGHPAELVRSYDGGTSITSFLMDTNGDGVADISIEAKGNHTAFNDFFF